MAARAMQAILRSRVRLPNVRQARRFGSLVTSRASPLQHDSGLLWRMNSACSGCRHGREPT